MNFGLIKRAIYIAQLEGWVSVLRKTYCYFLAEDFVGNQAPETHSHKNETCHFVKSLLKHLPRQAYIRDYPKHAVRCGVLVVRVYKNDLAFKTEFT